MRARARDRAHRPYPTHLISPLGRLLQTALLQLEQALELSLGECLLFDQNLADAFVGMLALNTHGPRN
jgi:hypothetical protein